MRWQHVETAGRGRGCSGAHALAEAWMAVEQWYTCGRSTGDGRRMKTQSGLGRAGNDDVRASFPPEGIVVLSHPSSVDARRKPSLGSFLDLDGRRQWFFIVSFLGDVV